MFTFGSSNNTQKYLACPKCGTEEFFISLENKEFLIICANLECTIGLIASVLSNNMIEHTPVDHGVSVAEVKFDNNFNINLNIKIDIEEKF